MRLQHGAGPDGRPAQPPADALQRPDRALFLDVDGTLLQIAVGPGAVHVPARTRHALLTAFERECGAIALVGGRTIADLDRLFAPLRLPAIGVHGLEWRDAAGCHGTADVPPRAFDAARRRIALLVAAHAGLELEDKRFALAVHFRLAPHVAPQVHALLEELAGSMQPHCHVQAGKHCLELRPALDAKRPAIEAFMREPPFTGRLPVFIGDDSTDEQGFEAVNALGGVSIHVGNRPGTAARWQFANVNAVVHWLLVPDRAAARARHQPGPVSRN